MISRDSAVLITAILCGAIGYFAGYSQDRRCPEVPGAQYKESAERGDKLQCFYAVQITRKMVRGLTKAEGGRR